MTENQSDKQVISNFHYPALYRLGLIGVVAFVSSLIMFFNVYVLLGITVPPALRKLIAVLAIVLGSWLLYAAITRRASKDPAIWILGTDVYFYVNPGRKVKLKKSSITAVTSLSNNTRIRRWILGDKYFEVKTKLPEGIFASSIIIGSIFLQEDIAVVNEKLKAFKMVDAV